MITKQERIENYIYDIDAHVAIRRLAESYDKLVDATDVPPTSANGGEILSTLLEFCEYVMSIDREDPLDEDFFAYL